jgi:hypothetical protein
MWFERLECPVAALAGRGRGSSHRFLSFASSFTFECDLGELALMLFPGDQQRRQNGFVRHRWQASIDTLAPDVIDHRLPEIRPAKVVRIQRKQATTGPRSCRCPDATAWCG